MCCLQLFCMIMHRTQLDNATKSGAKIIQAFVTCTERKRVIKGDPEDRREAHGGCRRCWMAGRVQ